MHDVDKILKVLQQNINDAEKMVRDNIHENPHIAQSHILLAYVLSQKSDYKKAQSALMDAVHLNPDSMDAYFNLGYISQQLGDLQAAMQHYQKSAALSNGRYHEAQLLLGNTLHQRGDCQRAIWVYCDFLKKRPNDVRGLFYLAQVYKESQQYRLADQQLEKLQAYLRDSDESITACSVLTHFFSRYDFYQWQRFDNKAALTQIIQEYNQANPDQPFSYYPETFILPEQYERFSQAHKQHGKKAFWIEKSANAFCGQGAKLVSHIRHLKSCEPCVVQRYIDDPLLLNDRKFNIRLYCVVSMANPLQVFLWKEGIVFVSSEIYECSKKSLGNVLMHIINPVLSSHHTRSAEEKEVNDEDFLRFSDVLQQLHKMGYDAEVIQNNIVALVKAFFQLVQAEGLFERQTTGHLHYAYPPKVIGLDVLLDASLQPKLLEVERFPGLTGLKPLTKAINEDFAQDMVALVSVLHTDSTLEHMKPEDYMAEQLLLTREQAQHFESIL